ncbi:hypothetical protein TNCV_665901 [Trichonephila clavipes]|uniref:Uncharacterized protein n=1 Tax=Trichonephila clavipes TaxID=2585209 RepID=A0A8X6VC94_TRICX|nr:hypothetical protein TNCV_665901 [Trichonephila clavipes]
MAGHCFHLGDFWKQMSHLIHQDWLTEVCGLHLPYALLILATFRIFNYKPIEARTKGRPILRCSDCMKDKFNV